MTSDELQEIIDDLDAVSFRLGFEAEGDDAVEGLRRSVARASNLLTNLPDVVVSAINAPPYDV